ncbi:MAG: flagellar motor protein MotA [Alphaproteobacteria bacterium]|jgi:chemotaxis protein MotA|nr:flagellar motor protein MotA [Alphaproteobacteria bacterium]MBT4020266.1 flagellar motor protein MotA [Alphaproteobacteria bacterium]MBT4965461.1 flagellar motor protein MotA [Alphaproteobacteria bacterium]MBT5918793.1 flagellar motor protein MotA [Alphaproteobacteria bacterium]
MDIATLIGLLAGFGLVSSAIILGGSVSSFIDIPAILIVIGGTFGITMISYSLREILSAQGVILKTIFHSLPDAAEAAEDGLRMAIQSRKDGVLALQKVVAALDHNPFLKKALSLAIDGSTGDDIERVMGHELSGMAERHSRGVGILRRSAEVAPAMGLIGTLIGLVQMLGKLDDPSSIGPAMAVALLTTFYGAVLANMVFSPLAGKLERNSKSELVVNRLYIITAASIGRGENPRRLEMLLNTILPPSQRLHYFE